MRTALAVLAFSLASTLSAANMWFDPPNPTSNTPVTAHVAVPGSYCYPTNASAERHGNIISISLSFGPCTRPALPGPFDVPVTIGVQPPGIYDVVAGPDQLLLGLAEGTLVVREPNPPFVVSPDAGREGDTVTITGVNNCSSSTQCDTVGVLFGTTAATVVSNTPAGITVRVPALPDGPTDVTVGGKTAVAAFDVTTGGVLDPAFFAPVLIPVFFSGPGANGSQWRTELTVSNRNDYPVVNDSGLFGAPCGIVNCPDTRLQAGAIGIAVGQNDSEGKLIEFDRAALPNVFLDARVRDLSRETQDLGAELPVVLEKDLYAQPFDLLNVPADPNFRATLRAYRLDGGATVHVTIRPMLQPTATALVNVDIPLHNVGNMRMVAVPNLGVAYPQLAGKGPLVITISGGPAPATWAFVSVTNNDTQRVTVISPQ